MRSYKALDLLDFAADRPSPAVTAKSKSLWGSISTCGGGSEAMWDRFLDFAETLVIPLYDWDSAGKLLDT